MNKIYNYILEGRGIGARFLLIFALIIAIAIGITVKVSGSDFIPYAQSIADQMLPIRIEKGIVVEPYNTIKVAKLDFEGMPQPYALPLEINTTVDTLDTSKLKDGVYLTRTMFYSINENEARIRSLEGISIEIPQADYTDFFKSVLTWTALITTFFGCIALFVLYFALTLFYTACSFGVSALAAKKYNFDQRMRLSALSLIATYVIFIPMDWIGLNTTRLLFFLVVVIIESLVISRLPKQEVALVLPENTENK